MRLNRTHVQLGGKYHCTLKDPFATGDKNFHRRVLQVTRFDATGGVWCEWRERVDGHLETMGNWLPKGRLVPARSRRGRKKS